MAPGEQIFPVDVPREIAGQKAGRDSRDQWPDLLSKWARSELAAGGTDLVGRAQTELERVLIECALEQTGGQRQKAAELLGLGRNTLTRKIQKIDSQQAG
jgi:two-component system nitrogen regulation response regulator GlnG